MWGLFNNHNISIDNILGNSEVLCWSAKWCGKDEVMFSSKKNGHKKRMLKRIYDMLNEADVVVTYNGNAFDLKILNKEFALQGWGPPSPYKSVDLLATVRKRFRFTSNKLGYVSEVLGVGEKVKNSGTALWLSCMNPKAADYEDSWKLMRDYNIQDTVLLESLYNRIKGWIPSHPNVGAFDNTPLVCPNCGSKHVQRRGLYRATTMTYRRYSCNDCGKWSRERVPEKANRAGLLVGAV